MKSLSPSPDINHQQALVNALSNSLYAGAKRESVLMVLNYCQAAQLDPFIKPVHIVPMSVKNPVTGRYEFRDVVMPGITLYRIQAARSQKYAGVSEPEFGPLKTLTLSNGQSIQYPTYCKITVKRLEGDKAYAFSAKEFWLENYATKGKDSRDPNTMWQKRPFGQLAKCAEAQALRKGFPDLCPAVTAEEIEGKIWEGEAVAGVPEQTTRSSDKTSTKDQVTALLAQPEKGRGSVSKTSQTLTDQTPQKKTVQDQLMQAIVSHKIPMNTVKAWLEKAGVGHTKALSDHEAEACLDWIEKRKLILHSDSDIEK